MIQLKCPVTKCVWGSINSQKDLETYIDKSGQRFGEDESGLFPGAGFTTHKGIDIPVVTGTEVHACDSGKVSRVSDSVTGGIGVVIYHQADNYESVYWHLKSHSVVPGDTIARGQLIGISNNTGYSVGPHLHFQCNHTNEHGQSGQAFDPLPYFLWGDILKPMTLGEITLLYEILEIEDVDGFGKTYWVGKPLSAFLKEYAKNKGNKLIQLSV